ncbi:hypothetical protein [Fundicoccus culcitae]|uniref:DUF6199 domain-containing protein n=1 Tax=Fundicoccus culcitae TaxID=2969821 RepID=A0ABY5P9C1_9LACT|nr:hypothetical protein [Fundicoccus culcitae]UUX35191.1 hypothetical protein NRE15_05990 [Fundicoccus culcitae]
MFFLLGIVLVMVGAWVFAYWPVVEINDRYEPLNAFVVEESRAYQAVVESDVGSVPEHVRLRAVTPTVQGYVVNRVVTNEQLNNVSGRINFLTGEFSNDYMSVAFKVEDGQAVPVDSGDGELAGFIDFVYASGKEGQEQIRAFNRMLLPMFLFVLVLVGIGLLVVRFGEGLARLSVRLMIKDAEPSGFMVFMTRFGGVVLVGVGVMVLMRVVGVMVG